MKIAQFIRPLFLVALGLHGLLLFLPLGESSEPTLIEEDVLISDKPKAATEPTETSPAPLPVPAASTIPAAGSTAAQTAQTSTPSRTTTPRTTVAVRPTNRQPVTGTAATTHSQSTTVSNPATTTPTNPAATGDRTTPPTSSQAGTDLPNLDANAAENPIPPATRPLQTSRLPDLTGNNDNTAASGGNPVNVGNNKPAKNLIATASGTPPETLRRRVSQISDALTYREPELEDQQRADWEALIRQQATNSDPEFGDIEAIAPTQIAQLNDLAQLNYPITAPKQDSGQSYRLCLEQPPRKAEIGVLFDALGNIASEPTLLSSTGYRAIDEEIKANVATYENFPTDWQSRAYTFEIEINYDAETCVSLEELQAQTEGLAQQALQPSASS